MDTLTRTIIDATGTRSTITYQAAPLSEGGEGTIYITTDRQHVVKIFHKHVQKRRTALQEILEIRPKEETEVAEYLAWPWAIVVDGSGMPIGVVSPNSQRAMWMRELIWYRSPKVWSRLPVEERGTFKGRIQAAICLTAAVRYINRIGYAHADLSGRNCHVNPVAGKAILIDLDGLVVPGYMEGKVLGTPGYMAPELVTGKVSVPNAKSDRHALAVVLYEFLLMDHPLKGARPPLKDNPESDERLKMGQEALYREHPTDRRNCPDPSTPFISASALGEELQDLFEQTFVDGLHDPDARPHPDQFEAALRQLEADLMICPNPQCPWGYFPGKSGQADHCPMCGTPVQMTSVGEVRILTHTGAGFYSLRESTTYQLRGAGLLRWHDVFGPGPGIRGNLLAITRGSDNEWLVTLHDDRARCLLVTPTEGQIGPLPPNQETRVPDGVQILAVAGQDRRLLEFGRMLV